MKSGTSSPTASASGGAWAGSRVRSRVAASNNPIRTKAGWCSTQPSQLGEGLLCGFASFEPPLRSDIKLALRFSSVVSPGHLIP